MFKPKLLSLSVLFTTITIWFPAVFFAQGISVKNDGQSKKIVFGNASINVPLNYKNKATITQLNVNGEQVPDASEGIYSMIKTRTAAYSTLQLSASPTVTVSYTG